MAKIHIAVLSKETLPIYYLIMATQPDKVYIISTVDMKDYSDRMKKMLGKKNIPNKILTVKPFDVMSTIQTCEKLHRHFTPEDKVSYNITGGTKPMAFGAYSVATKYNAEVLYTNSDTVIDMRTYENKALDVVVDSKTIFEVQGQELRSYEVYQDDPDKLYCAHAIEKFINEESSSYKTLRTQYDKSKLGNTYNDGKIRFTFEKSHLTIFKANTKVLDFFSSDALKLLFEGRWWETLVAHEVYQWAGHRFEVWQDVVLQSTTDENKDKNEMDILVNTGNKLLIIECKSGSVTQDNITKMASIRGVYGSVKSKSVLMPFWPVRENLFKKIRENNLSLIKPGENVGERLDKILASQRA